jgi:hypothetical protein
MDESDARETSVHTHLARRRYADSGRIPQHRCREVHATSGKTQSGLPCQGRRLPASHRALQRGRHTEVHQPVDPGGLTLPATQEDYAYFAEALLALYDLTGERHWLERAGELADALLERFLDQQGGGFYINETQASITTMGRPKDDGSDGAIPSGTSVTLRVLQGLWRRTGNLTYRQQTEALIDRFAATLARQPHDYSYMLTAITSHREGELQSLAYAAQGGIRLIGQLSPHTSETMQLTITLEIPPGWHINSAQPDDEDMIGTELHLADGASGWDLGPVSYPDGEQRQLAFQERPVSLFSGLVRFQALLTQTAAAPHSTLPVGVRMQACTDNVCLPPETPLLRIHRPY